MDVNIQGHREHRELSAAILRIFFGPIPAAILEASFYAVRRNCPVPLMRRRKAENRPESRYRLPKIAR